MDIGSAIIGVVIVALCSLPFFLMGQSRRKREKQMLHTIALLAKDNNCKISKHEHCGDFVIGIDEVRKVLFFNKKGKNKDQELVVNLNDVQTCKIINVSKTINSKSGNYLVVEKLDLCLYSKSKSNHEIRFELFNINDGTQLGDEIPVMEKWNSLINKLLN